MALFGVGSAIQKAIQTLILPEFEFIKGELKRLDQKIDSVKDELKTEFRTEIKRLDQKIDSVKDELKTEFRTEIKRLDQKIDSVDEKIDLSRNALIAEIHRQEQKIDSIQNEVKGVNQRMDSMLLFHERLARLEARMEMTA